MITSDGRCYVGVLRACDQATNLVMDQTVERIFSSEVCGTTYDQAQCVCVLKERDVYADSELLAQCKSSGMCSELRKVLSLHGRAVIVWLMPHNLNGRGHLLGHASASCRLGGVELCSFCEIGTRRWCVQEGVRVQEVGLYVLRGDHVYASHTAVQCLRFTTVASAMFALASSASVHVLKAACNVPGKLRVRIAAFSTLPAFVERCIATCWVWGMTICLMVFFYACRASIGEIDDDLDRTIDLGRVRAEPITPF